MRKATAALALLFLAAHLPFLAPTLEDIDSINFALGVANLDVSRHQPHPPGYPVFIALAKASTAVMRGLGVRSPESRGIAIWSALSGAASIFFLFALFRAVDRAAPPAYDSPPADRRAWWATVLVAVSPLFWFTALRPLSDTTGLAAALAAQALLASVLTGAAPPRTLVLGAFASGLAIGIRSQTFLLTLPLLALVLAIPRSELRMRDRLGAPAAVSIGVAVWGIPLVVASGGLAAYAAALGSQAGEDFSGVVMLWTNRSPRVMADAAMSSFLWPWGHPAAGAIVMALAAAGLVRVAWRAPRVMALLAVAFVPYTIFHLLFHEVVTVRYALPLVVPIAYLAASALEWAGGAVLVGGVALVAVWSLAVSVPAAVTYGREGSPAFRAFRSIERAAQRGQDDRGTGLPPMNAIGLHAVARRAAHWEASVLPAPVLTASHGREWLRLVNEWQSNPRDVIAFVADPRRTDLALIDPRSRRLVERYRWGFVEPPFVGGARPGNSDLYAMDPPGWMLDRGWALTAEIAGVTERDKLGPYRKPSVAWIRARAEDALLMIGGRHLGRADDPQVHIGLSLNGRPLESRDVPAGFFFWLVPVPAGALAGAGAYVPLEVRSEAVNAQREIAVALEQFDLQSAGTPMVGAETGWQEPEYNPLNARSWRWTTERATLWVRPVARDVTLTLTGESPLRYYDTAPTVRVTVGGREAARFNPSSDFTQTIVLPPELLAASDGRVVIETDKWFVPGDRDGSPDRRHLGLRIYSFSVR